MADESSRATMLLRDLGAGEPGAADELLPLIYDELRRVAQRVMHAERKDHTLQPTALVHEAWIKLVDVSRASFNDHTHFLAIAARAMRQVLIDHARARATAKRGAGCSRVLLDDVVASYQTAALDLVALDEALRRLDERDPELARLVELRFFGGLTVKETASVRGVSHRRIERSWALARAWLHRELAGPGDGEAT
jgi:RNA polymerase sigma factor (TIGR02999 family)